MYEGNCHCGAVRWTFAEEPEFLTDCNCSLCRRYAALWAYGTVETTSIEIGGPVVEYIHGDRQNAFVSCATCGCTTHWRGLRREAEGMRVAVNMRMAEPAGWAHLRVRRLDGADTWRFLD